MNGDFLGKFQLFEILLLVFVRPDAEKAKRNPQRTHLFNVQQLLLRLGRSFSLFFCSR